MTELSKNKSAMDLLKDYIWFNTIQTVVPDLHGMTYIKKYGYLAWPGADAYELKNRIDSAIAENSLPVFDGEDHSLAQLSDWMNSSESAQALAVLGSTLGLWTLNLLDNDDEFTPLSIRSSDVSGYKVGQVDVGLAEFLALNTMVLDKPYDFPCIDMGFQRVLVKPDACIDTFITHIQKLDEKGLNLFDLREHSYIEIGGHLDSQALALQLMAVCCEMGLARLMTPSTMLRIPNDSEMGQQMLGQGLMTIYFVDRSIEESKKIYKMGLGLA